MTTPRTPATSGAEIFIPFIILPDSEDDDITLPVRSASLPLAVEQQVIDLQESQLTKRLKIIELCNRVEYVETRLEQSHVRQTRDRVRLQRAEMTWQDVEALHVKAERAEKRAEAL
nr:hypothetical protein [Tanacetum cinerariifolium]